MDVLLAFPIWCNWRYSFLFSFIVSIRKPLALMSQNLKRFFFALLEYRAYSQVIMVPFGKVILAIPDRFMIFTTHVMVLNHQGSLLKYFRYISIMWVFHNQNVQLYFVDSLSIYNDKYHTVPFSIINHNQTKIWIYHIIVESHICHQSKRNNWNKINLKQRATCA